MSSALVVSSSSPDMPDLAADLAAAGVHVLGAVNCDNLVQQAVRTAPDVVVCWAPVPGDPLLRALGVLQATDPRPVIVFTNDVQAEPMESALDAGVQVWVVQGYAALRLRPLLQLAKARFRHEQRLREALQDMTHRYEERKLIDRAKGILMRARQIPEDDAFRLLRQGAMQAKQRVGQLAQQVIDSARDAEAVNRAGQLRMLSQRSMKLYALMAAGTEVPAARALLAQSLERTEQQIDQLQRTLSQPTFGDLLAAVVEAFDASKIALAAPPSMLALAEADERAERLLDRADRLTSALRGAAPVAKLHVINLSGRQRMLSQRLAKQALLGALLAGDAAAAARAEAGRTGAAFEQALAELKQAPLSTVEIRAGLDSADLEWQRMLQGVAGAGTPAGRLLLAQASEELLALFERLTERYEHSMQMLMG
jgi:AmiR/NasT family two-component response regulator